MREVLRRITATQVTHDLRNDLQTPAGGLQMCVGSRVEACIHGLRIFDAEKTEGIIQVDADNAFNRINRKVLLHNMNYFCPLLAAIIEHQSNEHTIETVNHVAFADDLTGCVRLIPLRKWWNSIIKHGPSIGYYANTSKSWLIVKEQYYGVAERVSEGSGLNIACEGRKETTWSGNWKWFIQDRICK